MSPPPIAILAGGTGGHVFAGIALAQALAELGVPAVFIGHGEGLEAKLVADHGYPFHGLQLATWRHAGWGGRLRAVTTLTVATARSASLLRKLAPGCVVSMGCFVAAPGGLAARGLGIPLVVHEQNEHFGQTNRWLARIASQTCWAADTAMASDRYAHCPSPVRLGLRRLVNHRRPSDPPHVLVLGGSAGSDLLNRCVPDALAALPDYRRLTVSHQTGEAASADDVERAYARAGIRAECQPFFTDMDRRYERATVAVSLAGALSIAELELAGIPAVLVPLSSAADDHQRANAQAAARRGSALWLDPGDIDRLPQRLGELMRRPASVDAERRRTLAASAERLARLCLSAAARSGPVDSRQPGDARR